MHLSCLQKDYDELASIQIKEFSEFLVDLIKVVNTNKTGDVKE